jgi:DNA-binding ferritin-like protein
MTYSGSFETSVMPPSVMGVEYTEEQEAEPKATADDLINNLVSLGSYINQLYLQSHLIHLNIEGPLFLPIHKFLKKQYETHIEQFDSLGELIRSMDYLMPMCAKGVQSACKSFKHVKSYDAREMMTVYAKNLEACGFMAKEVVEMAKVVGAPDIENYLAELVGSMFKSAWFLKATLRD